VSLRNVNGLPVTYAEVIAAAERLKGVAHRTPVMTSSTADTRSGGRLYFKCENLQRTGAFKFRGAFNAIANLSSDERRRGVVAYSSGNHAQAIALAGSLLGTPTTIVMPRDAPAVKVRATEAYGGAVLFYDRYREDREAIGGKLAADRGVSLIPSFDHPQVIAGQGTATLELIEEVGQLDRLFVSLGGGGLLAGAALVAKELSPGCKIIGVEPQEGNDGQQSLRAGRIIHIPVPKSIADGAVVTHLGSFNFPIIRDLVDEIATVTDTMLIETMRFFAERLKLVVEPTGCLAAAAVFSQDHHQRGDRIGVMISGGNVDMERFARLINQ
jgi:threo-3-hydroxy-L-aspartate ammonia-lyase